MTLMNVMRKYIRERISMEAFGSFGVDHTKLNRGIYLSRKDRIGNGEIFTLDVRLCKPYYDTVLSNIEAHSLEHILATRLENILKKSELKKVYVGPMGCSTGMYILIYVPYTLKFTEEEIVETLMITLQACTYYHAKEVPFHSYYECGNKLTLAENGRDMDKVNSRLDEIHSLATKVKENKKFDAYEYL